MSEALLVAFLLFASVVVHAEDLAVRISDRMIHYANEGFMGSVLVARGQTVVFEQGYGMANLELGVPNTVRTKFRIGSLTKQFTAAAILLLHDRGVLNIDNPITTYLPEAPPAWRVIKVHHLLTHTSGIPDYVNFNDSEQAKVRAWTPEQLIQTFRDRPLEFTPGSREEYSSSNYVVLGHLIEKMSRLSYADFVHNNLLLRLGMRDSGYDSHRQILSNRASGYAARTNIDWEAPSHAPEVLFNADYVNIDWAFAAGGLYSTVEDLLRWEKGLFSGNVLSPASLARMITPFLGGYACGLYVMKINGHRVINHNGGIDGFSSHLAYYPDDRVTVTVLSNVRARSVAPVAAELAVLAIGK